MNSFLDVAGIILFFTAAGIVYGMPALIAHTKKHPNEGWIAICNIFLGATGFVWVICLIWAISYGSDEDEAKLRARGLFGK